MPAAETPLPNDAEILNVTTDSQMSAPGEVPVIDGDDRPDAASIIVIHPGSRYLRLGKASDLAPKAVLHAIARRRSKAAMEDSKLQRVDPIIVPSFKLDQVSHRKLEECRRKSAQVLQKSLKSDGRRRFVESHETVAQVNLEQKPHKLSKAENDLLDTKADTVFGQDVLRLGPEAPYNVHFPYRRGDVNLHQSVSGSVTAILVDLEETWTNAIETELQIPRADFARYRVVLIIPAMYKRSFIKHYMTMLLNKMGFNSAFVTLDHVCAAFGAGLSKYLYIIDFLPQFPTFLD